MTTATNPLMEPETTEMVSVEWILQNVAYSVDFGDLDPSTWETLIRHKSSDAHFGNLCETIQQRGFRVPIVIDLEHLFRYGSDEEWCWCMALGNGHHRLAYAILFGVDSIPVFWSQGDYMREDVSTDEEDNLILSDWFDGSEDF